MNTSGRLISYQTYVRYANKYNLQFDIKSGKPKSMKILQKEIYGHETKLIKPGKTVNGLYYTK